MRKTLLSLACVLMTATAAAAAPAKVTFWHYFGDEGSTSALNAMAAEFNKSQGKYQVTPVGVGDYKTLNVKLIASLRGGGQPTMALVDNAFFTRLALGGQLAPLDDLMNDLPKAAQSDFYPVLWDYGIAGGKRYGLPWAASTLLLYYNTDLLKARNVAPPKTWAEFASAAKSLTTRASKGAVLICDAWIFGSIVTSRGGSLLTSDNLPNLDSAGTTGTLAFLQEMVRGGNAIARSTTEIEVAVMDFLRTKAAMVIAPSSAWAIANDHAVGFRPGVVPLPGKTLAGEAQLVVLKGAGTEETRGAYEFWKHLTTQKN
ncbi:MAG TPA: extracellular solute-binding protein, partial [Deinococcales bacterium]|nr:extracellular solute-binding protein [Deinococcales bacterium]